MKDLKGIKTLSKDEMKLIEGGDAQLSMSDYYRSKKNCLLKARSLVSTGKVTGMTQQGVAEEIFAHAVAYYKESTFRGIPGVGDSIADYLVEHADPIDIADGGDTLARRIVFSAVWEFMPEEF